MKHTRLFYYLFFYCFVHLFISSSWAQTTLISSTGEGGFETGTSFGDNGWTVVNHAINTWQVGTAATAFAGSRGAYISNNSGTSWIYTNNIAQTSHFYRDVTVPAGETVIQLSFLWKGNGEASWDRLLVYSAPTNVTPVAGTPASNSTNLSGASLVYTQANNSQSTYTQANITLNSSLAGSTFRLIFTWQNDNSTGSIPVAIDNISLISYPAMSGIYTIDNNIAESATNFNSFSSAIQAVNIRGISSSVTFNVTAGQTFNENLPALTATGTSSNTITFQKSGDGNNPKIVPTGIGTTDFGICISGGDYITFDGIDVNGSAATNSTNAIEFGYLIRNASATNGAQYNTIKNCAISLNKNYVASVTSACLFSSVSSAQGGVAPTNATGANSYNKFYNLTLSNAQNGIYAVGNSTYPDLSCEFGVAGSGCQTSRNSISNMGGVLTSSSSYGIYAQYQSGGKIFNSDISNIRSNANTTAGILLINFVGTNEIYNNKVSDISNSGTTTGTSLAAGIQIQNSSGTATARVYNNFIYDIKSSFISTANSTIMAYGVYCNVSTSSTTAEIDNNNVYLSVASGTPTYSSACFGINSTAGIHKVRGNIFVNAFPNQTSNAFHTSFYSSSTTSIGGTGSISNFNDLYVTGTNGYVGRGISTNYLTLANWQSRTGTPDANSISIDPSFISSTDLHVSATGLTGISGFTPQTWVTKDFDCDPQGPTYRIGADAPAGSACVTPTDQATNLQLTTITSNSLQASFTVAASSPSGYLVVRSNSNTLSSYPVNATSYAVGNALGGGVVVQSSIGTSFSESSLTDNTTYYYFVFSYNNSGCSGGPIYNVTSPLTGSTTTCLAAPSTPTFSSITSSGMTINWGAVTGASSYILEVSTNSGFTAPISGSPFSVVATSEELTELISGNTYYVRVTAVGGNCNSAVSASANTTLTCAVPSNQATSLLFSNITTSSISGSFTAATSTPTGYLVVRSTNSTLSASPVDGISYISGNSIGGGTVVQVGINTTFTQSSLSSNTTYYYYIFSYNNASCSGGPVYNTTNPLTSNVTTCLSGTPTTPTLSNETTESIQASWSAFAGATSYRLDVSTSSLFTSYVVGYQDLLVNGTSFVITGLNPNTLYYVRIRAHNESCPSSNSNAASRTTLKIEPSNQPTNFAASSASTNSISLSWTAAIAGSQLPDGYLIKGSATSLSAISDPVDGTDPGTGSLALSSGVASYKTSSSSGTFTGHTAGTMYFYKIYSYTNASTGIDFKTNNVPNLYQATQPNNSGTPVFTATPLNAGQATITWTQPSGFDAAKHKILVFVKSGSTAISTTALNTNPTTFSANTVFGSGTAHSSDVVAYCVYNGDGTSVTISGLSANTTYQVRILVGMLDANSNSTYTYSSGVTTSGTTFKTEPSNQPTNFTASSASTSSIPLSWTAAIAGSQSPDGYLIKGSATSLSAISDPVDGTDPGTGSLA
ncbi:MAG: beta strand repeat-containing protein, partial [Dolichospermum sp.]